LYSDFCYYIGAEFYGGKIFIISGKLLLAITVNFWADRERVGMKKENWKFVGEFF
jgi:hypothetical protein